MPLTNCLGSITRNGKKRSPRTRNFSIRWAAWCRKNCKNSASNWLRGLICSRCPEADENSAWHSEAATEICEESGDLELSPVSSRIGNKERVVSQAPNDCIEIRGARQNNLKGIDVDLPLGKLTVIT